jgi:NAD(P)-dependent dehydrogenase (short-subunit alcohol dehydrogenase family)
MSTDSLSLANKVAIVTGSGRENGIGAAIAQALARAGARVTINYVSESSATRAAQVVSSIESAVGKGAATSIRADVSTTEGSKKIVDETLRSFGVDHIDIIGECHSPNCISQPIASTFVLVPCGLLT